MTGGSLRGATRLETLWVEVPEDAVPAYESALATVCGTVGFFLNETTGDWVVEGVRDARAGTAVLAPALLMAEAVTGVAARLCRRDTEAAGWLARTLQAFPRQRIGRRFVVQATHDATPPEPGCITLVLDAGVAFGSGEHGSTRGCLRALEAASRRPRDVAGRVIDLGTGSGILAMAAALLLRPTGGRPVLATDIEPWSVRTAAANAALNGLSRSVRCVVADGWWHRSVRRGGPYGLVFANILARPLCAMARDLSVNLRPGGTAILSGLLVGQARMVLAAHRRRGLVLRATVRDGNWATLTLRRPAGRTIARGL